MFASIPNYKEFYIENDLNKQAGAQAWVGNTGLNPTDNYCSYVALSIRAPHKQGPLDTMGLFGQHRTKLNKQQKIYLAMTTGTS